MNYGASDIASFLGLDPINSDLYPSIHYICVDTRSIVRPSSTLFVALPGKHKDGHDFIDQAYHRGVRHFVTSRPVKLPDACIYIVPDTLRALQKIAAAHRLRFDIPVISITGSNGKTTVKEWLYQLVSTQISAHKSPLSYNSQIGVPLSIFGIQSKHEAAILEAGISQMDEMDYLSQMLQCSIGIFTTLGDSHSSGFKNSTDKLKEKIKLFNFAHTIIYNQDQKEVGQIIKSTYPEKKFITTSLISDQADFYIYKKNGKIELKHNGSIYVVPFQNAYETTLKNIASILAGISSLGISIEKTLPHLAEVTEIPMRMQLDYGTNGSIIINDGYNADLQSFESALGFMQLHASRKKRKLVLSQFAELTDNDEVVHKLGELIFNYNIQEVYAIGDRIENLHAQLKGDTLFYHFSSAHDLLASNLLSAQSNDIILLKGARSFHLEDVHRHLSTKMHRTILEIDLEALGHNLSCHAQLLSPKTKIMAMVKASAYGSGIEEISAYLEFRQVDYFGVAFIDEGIALRRSGITTPIMVLSPAIGNLDMIREYRLEPSINSLAYVYQLTDSLDLEEEFGIHVNIDTGMNRSGIDPSEIQALLVHLRDYSNLKVISIYSHLAAADEREHDDFTRAQIRRFSSLADDFSNALGYIPLKHVLNSNGLLYFPEDQMDMVRLGIGLYGVEEIEIHKERLLPVHTLKSTISHIHDIVEGESVGYNRAWIADKPTRIATIQIGYADGLPRKSGQKGYEVSVRGQLAPIIGNVCMDLTMIDITKSPDARVGDEVIIYGKGRSIAALAQLNDTISYEILSNTSERVKRIYLS